jgi:magnesium transporter
MNDTEANGGAEMECSPKWKWYELDFTNEERVRDITSKYDQCSDWIKDAKDNKTNMLQIDSTEPGKESMWGSLVYFQDVEQRQKNLVFHFYLTREFLITGNFKVSMLDKINQATWKKKMDTAETPIDAFMLIIGEIMYHFLLEIDEFEARLNHLLWEIKENNKKKILDNITVSKHEILIWKHLIIPMKEAQIGTEETFGDEVQKGPQFIRTCRRINRIQMLLQEYDHQIEGMVNIENLVANHRGNEIIKTLTVLTTLFTPVMAWGAIWGMNFTHMPELKWSYGYLMSILVIVFSSIVLYLYLKKKGWMGDILKVQKKKSFLD